MIDLSVFLWVSTFLGTKVAFGIVLYVVLKDEYGKKWAAAWKRRREAWPGVAEPQPEIDMAVARVTRLTEE